MSLPESETETSIGFSLARPSARFNVPEKFSVCAAASSTVPFGQFPLTLPSDQPLVVFVSGSMVNHTPSATLSVVLCVLKPPCTSTPAPESMRISPLTDVLSIWVRFFQSSSLASTVERIRSLALSAAVLPRWMPLGLTM